MKEKYQYPKVLIISYNALRDDNNNGKTLFNLFKYFPDSHLTQIYFKNEFPTRNLYKYIRITDSSIIKNRLFKKNTIEEIIDQSIIQNHKIAKEKKVKSIFKNDFVKIFREIVWRYFYKRTTEIEQLIKEFKPDVIFYDFGDQIYLTNFVLYLNFKYQIPIATFFTDDYLNNKKFISPFKIIRKKLLNKVSKLLIKSSSKFFVISECMQREYEKFFNISSTIIMNYSEFSYGSEKLSVNSNILTYIGNLHTNRWKSLIMLGKALDNLKTPSNIPLPQLLIYSSSKLSNKVLRKFNKIKSLKFMGAVNSKEISKLHQQTDYLVHVEGFDDKSKDITRLSLSTKIPEYLQSQKCILAFGPSDVSSIEYLKKYSSAYVIESNNLNVILEKLTVFFEDINISKEIIRNAKELFEKKHSTQVIQERLVATLISAASENVL